MAVEAQNRDKTATLATGSLLAIDNQVDPATLMVRLKATFENKEHTLYPNQAVNVRLLVDTRRDTVLIPTPAVQHSADGASFVYVVKGETAAKDQPAGQASGHGRSDTHRHDSSGGGAHSAQAAEAGMSGVVVLRHIKTGPAEGGLVSVESGLEPGEIVVVEGVDKLQPGSRIIGQWSEAAGTQPAPTTAPADKVHTRPAHQMRKQP